MGCECRLVRMNRRDTVGWRADNFDDYHESNVLQHTVQGALLRMRLYIRGSDVLAA